VTNSAGRIIFGKGTKLTVDSGTAKIYYHSIFIFLITRIYMNFLFQNKVVIMFSIILLFT